MEGRVKLYDIGREILGWCINWCFGGNISAQWLVAKKIIEGGNCMVYDIISWDVMHMKMRSN